MKQRTCLWGMTAILAIASVVWGQPTSPPGEATGVATAPLSVSEKGELPSFQMLFGTSPTINSIILALSVVSLLLFIYFLVTINMNAMAPPTFVDDVSKMILARKYDEAAALCRANRKLFIASIIQRATENAGKEHSVIIDLIDSEGRRRADVMWNRISYLADVANVAPMLGLLGTVIGMLQTFLTLKETTGNITSSLLSSGIGGAMATTFFGLTVAIMTTIFYSIVKARATRTLANVEQIVHSVVDHIKRGAA